MAGAIYCTLKPEYHKIYQLTGFASQFSHVISYGAIWLPILMLIPYYFLLKDWQCSITPNLVKMILVIASALGFLKLTTPKLILKSYKKFDEKELAFNKAMDNINSYSAVMSLLYYTCKSYDEPIRNAALTKIKACKRLEEDLIDILEKDRTAYDVFNFLDDNKVDHPERFIEPIIKNLTNINKEMRESITDPYSSIYDIDVLLRVLEGQFKDSTSKFKPHILKLQEILETPPAKNHVYADTEKSNQTLFKNREEVKNWLARH